jgi:hypothetical protein
VAQEAAGRIERAVEAARHAAPASFAAARADVYTAGAA